jgi:hypothetical protein
VTAVYRFVWVGPVWGLTQHTTHFVLLLLWGLLVLSVFGGALTRVAAVQIARNEKISLRSALRFSTGKFVSFVSAPLIPVAVILLLVAATALVVLALWAVGLIPYLGWVPELGLAVVMPLALIAGVIMALALVGLLGGSGLMYPTIAVEGTDSFDAISRSFSYVFARPWRLAFYAVVALAYGAITFLFVRLFLWLVLVCTHGALSIALFRDAAGVNLLDALWPAPGDPADLSPRVAFINLTFTQDVAATAIASMIYVLVGLLAAYVVSLYFSMGTIIYYLMRREVDLTEYGEVYIDPADEEYGAYADDVTDAEGQTGADPDPAAVGGS